MEKKSFSQYFIFGLIFIGTGIIIVTLKGTLSILAIIGVIIVGIVMTVMDDRRYPGIITLVVGVALLLINFAQVLRILIQITGVVGILIGVFYLIFGFLGFKDKA